MSATPTPTLCRRTNFRNRYGALGGRAEMGSLARKRVRDHEIAQDELLLNLKVRHEAIEEPARRVGQACRSEAQRLFGKEQ